MVITGVVMFAASYVASVILATAVEHGEFELAAIPLGGPWLELAPVITEYGEAGWYWGAMVGWLGAMEASGALCIAIGLLARREERSREPTPVSMRILPVLAPAQVGVRVSIQLF